MKIKSYLPMLYKWLKPKKDDEDQYAGHLVSDLDTLCSRYGLVWEIRTNDIDYMLVMQSIKTNDTFTTYGDTVSETILDTFDHFNIIN